MNGHCLHEEEPLLRGEVDQLSGLAVIHRERLLDQHVLSCLQRHLRQRVVRRVDCRDVDDVHFRVLGHGLVVAVGAAAEILAELGEGIRLAPRGLRAMKTYAAGVLSGPAVSCRPGQSTCSQPVQSAPQCQQRERREAGTSHARTTLTISQPSTASIEQARSRAILPEPRKPQRRTMMAQPGFEGVVYARSPRRRVPCQVLARPRTVDCRGGLD